MSEVNFRFKLKFSLKNTFYKNFKSYCDVGGNSTEVLLVTSLCYLFQDILGALSLVGNFLRYVQSFEINIISSFSEKLLSINL